jgi:hypothetical protein
VATIINNNASQGDSAGSGSGIPRRRQPFGSITIFGEIGDVIRLPLADLVPNASGLLRGVQAQAITASVVIESTLVTPDIALNPIQDTGGHWVADRTVAAGTIATLQYVPTVMRITFAAKATLYLMAI